jgi:hypothetical protein
VGEFRDAVFLPNNSLTLNEAAVQEPGGRVLAVRPEQVWLRDANTDFKVHAERRAWAELWREVAALRQLGRIRWRVIRRLPAVLPRRRRSPCEIPV